MPEMAFRQVPEDWPNRAQSRVIASGSHRWHVQVIGEGPVILLLHGAGGATHSWRHLIPLLSPRFTLVAPDLPGQGYSTLGRRNHAGLDPMATDLARLCADQGWAPVAIIGHSAGAAVALRLSELLPAAPGAVIGLNAALGHFEGIAGWLFPLMAKVLALNPLVPSIFARLSGSEARVRSLLASTGSRIDDQGIALYQRLVSDSSHVDGTLAMMSQWSIGGLLSRLPMFPIPVLFLTGDNDLAVPPSTSAEWAAKMPNAEVTTIGGAGHLVHEERPEEVAAKILGFLEKIGAIPDV